VYSVGLSADGGHALSASRDKTIRVWNLASGRSIRVFEGHTDVVRAVRFLNADRWALSGSEDTTLRLWDVRTGLELWRGGTTGRVLSVAPSPDGRRAIAGTYDRRVLLWDLPSA
jgi:WD40 repeat protein